MKWLISQTNSVWGLKKNGRGVQFYSHVVNFPNDNDGSKKAEFLNNNVFTNLTEDYRQAVKKMSDKAFRERDANSTSFRVVRSEEYPNLSTDELLNHDFAVAYDEKTDKYSYWAITGTLATNNNDGRVNNNIIEFEATRDWMFELGIENLFDSNKQVEIMRAHINDIQDNKWNISMDSENAFVEKIEDFTNENYQPKTIEEIKNDYDASTIPSFYYVVSPNTLNNLAGEVTATAPISSVLFSQLLGKYWIIGNSNDIQVYNIETETWTLVYKGNGAGTNMPINIDLLNNEELLFVTKREPNVIYSFNGTSQEIFLKTENNIIDFYIDSETYIYLSSKDNNQTTDIYNILDGKLITNLDVNPTQLKKFRYRGSGDNQRCYFLNTQNLNKIWWVTTTSAIDFDVKNSPANSSFQSVNPLMTDKGAYCVIRNNSDMTYSYWELDVGTNSTLPTFNKTDKVNFHDYLIEYTGGNPSNWKVSYNVAGNNFSFDIQGNTTMLDPFYSWNVYQKTSINDFLNTNSIAIVSIQLKDNVLDLGGTTEKQSKITFDSPPKITFSSPNSPITNNYYSFIVPIFKYGYTSLSKEYENKSFNDIYQLIESSPYLYKITVNQINILDPTEFRFLLTNDGWVIAPSNTSTFKLIKGTYNDGEEDKWSMLFLFKETINQYDNISDDYQINVPNYDTDLTKGFVLDNIAKLHRHPYKRFYVKTTNDTKMFIMPQLLSNKWRLKLSYSWGLENEHLLFKVMDIDNATGIYNTDLRYNIWFQDVNTFSLTQTNDPAKQYLIRNRDQLQQRSRYNQQRLTVNDVQLGINMAGNVIQTIMGIGQAGVGLALGNPYLVAGGARSVVGGIQGIGQNTINYEKQRIDIENDIAQQKALLQDLHNSPNSLVGNGSDLNMWISKTLLNPIYVEEELWPSLKQSVGWYLHLFGSNLSGIPKNINNYLSNKYFFNHIQAKSLFENYEKDVFLNNLIRQINDLSFRDGITIWHYRNKNTFKGIKNYNVNNIDINQVKEFNG